MRDRWRIDQPPVGGERRRLANQIGPIGPVGLSTRQAVSTVQTGDGILSDRRVRVVYSGWGDADGGSAS